MFHNYHILSYSVYAFLIFMIVLGVTSSLVMFFKWGIYWFLIFCFIVLMFLCFLWGKDIVLEGLSGYHNHFVMDGFKLGMILFVFSEVMFFFSIFWVFFDLSLVPVHELNDYWVNLGLLLINPFGVPLLNTIILLSSGVSVTWCHYSLLCNKNGFLSLFFTCLLALYFTMFQLMEYYESSFSISDGVFGSIFFLSTGFHGLHVFFGSVFLFFNMVRLLKSHFNFNHHLGLEFGILYWHFVDVVWLFLFVFVYWWMYCY
uniref:Cytochrome c oxidase subunit 3 n=3 Tax=Dictyocaulus viviparus TaxID=29172 RepID=K7QM27_DICVI|nr:cytochrome c oxidase subunit III [Dictyocaulus viviparus]AFV32113.1 cytochrome c oxidase subunit III [Dictyocaulus viviparus]